MGKNIFKIVMPLFMLILMPISITSCDKENSSNPNSLSTSEERVITSEVNLTYTHTKTEVKWASEEIKKTQLEEMETDEETFFNSYDKTKLDVSFLEDNKAEVIFSMNGKSEACNVFYKKDSQSITFYDTEDDMKNNNVKTNMGVFSGKFKLATDYKTLFWIAEMPDILTVTLSCTIK